MLGHAGSISKKEADEHAQVEYANFAQRRHRLLEAEAARNLIDTLEDLNDELSDEGQKGIE